MPSATRVFNLTVVMSKAWTVARSAARRFNAPARQFIAEALRQIWREEKRARAETAAMRERILATVAALKFEASELGLARQRRADAALEVELAAHRAEMASRMASYQARWGTGASVHATRVAA